MSAQKTFKTYQQQLELLKSRGMYVQNQEAAIELAIRVMVGHELGKIDPLVHLDASKFGTLASAAP